MACKTQDPSCGDGRLSEASRGKRILIFTSGSRGDVQPFAAFAAALQGAGFVLRVLTNENHVGFMRGFGLDTVGFKGDSEASLREDPELLECMAKGELFKFFQKVGEKNKAVFPEALRTQLQVFREFQPDLALTGIMDVRQAKAMGDVAGVPVLVCSLTPFCLDAGTPSPMGEPAWMPGWVHRAISHLLLLVVIDGDKAGKYSALLDQLPECKPYLGQSLCQDAWGINHAVEPNIFAVSAAACPTAKVHTAGSRPVYTGFWVVGQEEQKQRMEHGDANFGGASCDRLGRFLASGDAPAYIGWGSMVSVSPEYMACLAVRALRLAGIRGVVLGGWAGLDADKLRGQPDSEALLKYAEEQVLFVSTAAHEWLFPQCLAVVHHGGSGTMAASLRSGRPSIITPCGFEQFFHAWMVGSSGAGLALPHLAKVTPKRLAAALRRAREDQALIQRAAALGKQLRSEDGLQAAVSTVDHFIRDELATGIWKARHKEAHAEGLKLAHPSMMQKLGLLCSICCTGGR